jgi:hypothetical protein
MVTGGSVVYAGDVIVAPEVRQSHLVYVVRVEGGSDQLAFSSRGEATANAVAYARRAGVNVWLGDGAELGFVRLGCFREVRPSTAAEHRAAAAAAVRVR